MIPTHALISGQRCQLIGTTFYPTDATDPPAKVIYRKLDEVDKPEKNYGYCDSRGKPWTVAMEVWVKGATT